MLSGMAKKAASCREQTGGCCGCITLVAASCAAFYCFHQPDWKLISVTVLGTFGATLVCGRLVGTTPRGSVKAVTNGGRAKAQVAVAHVLPQTTVPPAGTITPHEVMHLEQIASALGRRLKDAASGLRSCRIEQGWCHVSSETRGKLLSLRAWVNGGFPLGRVGCWLVMAAVCTGVGVAGVATFTLTPGDIVSGGLTGLLIGAAAASATLFVPKDRELVASRSRQLQRFATLAQSRVLLEAQERDARQQFEQARDTWLRAKSDFESTRNQLLLCDWRSLRGIPFETFLQRVFESLGYQVETTKVSGDQGVDLILTRGAERVAVQAKGYEQSVGNEAVQQAFTGMHFYRCTRCVVVTNSTFTHPAAALATTLPNCKLVDGDQIDALITGRVSI